MGQEIEGEILEERAGGELVPVVQNTALMYAEKASIDMQIATANRYPRSVTKFQQKLLEFAKTNPKLAAMCMYSKPQAGGTVKGPSARFAEMVASSYKNLRIASRVVEVGYERIIVQGVTHDLENNLLISVEVPSSIMGKNGRYGDDLINTNLKAAMSKARRDSILQVVPRALWMEAFEVCLAVGKGDIASLEQDRGAAFEYLNRTFKVDKSRVLAALGVESEKDIDLDKLADLRGYLEAIRAQEITVAECFPEGSRADSVREKLATRKANKGEPKPALDEPAEEKPEKAAKPAK